MAGVDRRRRRRAVVVAAAVGTGAVAVAVGGGADDACCAFRFSIQRLICSTSGASGLRCEYVSSEVMASAGR
jgi:hypothetical protein